MSGQKTILLIDDEADLVLMMHDILTKRGYRVLTAHNGEEGLKKIKHDEPHLIILDMNMPKMGGIAFYEAISAQDGKSRYPVLVLTARSNLEQLFRSFEIDGFIRKPFEIQDLLEEVKTILSKQDPQETGKH